MEIAILVLLMLLGVGFVAVGVGQILEADSKTVGYLGIIAAATGAITIIGSVFVLITLIPV